MVNSSLREAAKPSGPTRTAADVAEAVGGRVEGDPHLPISGISGLRGARPGDLSFVADNRHAALAAQSAASVLLVPDDCPVPPGCRAVLIRVSDLAAALDRVTGLFAPPPAQPVPGVHPSAVIALHVTLGENVSVGPCAVLEEGSRIGSHTVIGAQVFIGRGAVVGEHTVLHPGVKICRGCLVGSRVILHPGVVIGGDGFGYVFRSGRHENVPQIGTAVIEDDVEIGSNTTVDRARFGATRVGRGTKIDNLVMIAHNVQVGEHCVITGQCGIAGSSELGDYVMLGAQAGIIDHIRIGHKAMVAAGSGVIKDVPDGQTVMGGPAEPHDRAIRSMAIIRRLPELARSVKDLARRVDALGRQLQAPTPESQSLGSPDLRAEPEP